MQRYTHANWFLFLFFFFFFLRILFIFREGKGGRKGEKRQMCGCLSRTPCWGPVP